MSKTNLIISSEGDLEHNINYITKLALSPGSTKKLGIVFPSAGLMHIFMENLFQSFVVNEVPRDNNLDIVLNIPDHD
jgi:hypothetical protein